MPQLAFAGLVALAFGLVAHQALGATGVFPLLHFAGGGLCLAAALALGARRLRRAGGVHARRELARGLLRTAVLAAAAVAGQRLAAASGIRFDWTLEQRYEFAPATVEACRALPQPRALLLAEPGDPRLRHTRALLLALAAVCPIGIDERELSLDGGSGEDEEELRSNGVEFSAGGRSELVERPLEGAIFEALMHLRRPAHGEIGWLRGAGGGDPAETGPRGFSALAAALATEGHALRELDVATLVEVPPGLRAVLALAPERPLPETALAALDRHLERGGRLVALLEPGRASGIEALLADWGLHSADRVVLEPGARAIFGLPAGLAIAASHYETHAATRGLGPNRVSFFAGARAFALRKPAPEDRVDELVWSSGEAWLAPGPETPPAAELAAAKPSERAYQVLAAAGRYERGAGEARVLAFGDSDFASNRYLRAVYNLDLILNGVHWLLREEPAITLRPKVRDLIQFPLPLADTLTTFYGVGLLLPELLLLAAGLAWLRNRSA